MGLDRPLGLGLPCGQPVHAVHRSLWAVAVGRFASLCATACHPLMQRLSLYIYIYIYKERKFQSAFIRPLALSVRDLFRPLALSVRDNSSDSRTLAGRGGDNDKAAQNEAGNYGNGAPRGGYSGGRGYGSPRGDYSGGGRDDGGYGAPRGWTTLAAGATAAATKAMAAITTKAATAVGTTSSTGATSAMTTTTVPRGRGYYGNGRNSAPKPIVVEDMNLFPPLPASSAPPRAAAPAAAPTAAPAQS